MSSVQDWETPPSLQEVLSSAKMKRIARILLLGIFSLLQLLIFLSFNRTIFESEKIITNREALLIHLSKK